MLKDDPLHLFDIDAIIKYRVLIGFDHLNQWYSMTHAHATHTFDLQIDAGGDKCPAEICMNISAAASLAARTETDANFPL